MRKKLILCRHADAAAPLPGQPDVDRYLTPAGLNQAKETAARLQQKKLLPKFLVSSPAKRARQTADAIINELALEAVSENAALYEATAATLLAIVNAFPDSAETVLLVGHNPGISYLATSLTGQTLSFNTGQILVLEIEADQWAHVSAGTANLIA